MTIAWASFTPWLALSGGVLIGLSATLLWLGMGRIAGISGIAGSLFSLKAASGDRAWRWLFLIGLIAGAFIVHLLTGGLFEVRSGYPIWLLVGGALLVGIGTRMGSGCTSGHGVCGLARLSMRGLAATLTFMGTAFVTVFVIRHLLGFGGSA
ncbi:MAG: YeeE/YedE family protein [Wenzhouxiangella sp.]|nr:YeeE/YedE family protein [Wenzhouxiangella sp.]